MIGQEHSDADLHEQQEQTRLAIAALLVPIFFAIGFAACILGAYHKPHPHGIKLAIVGPSTQTADLRARLAKATGSAFDVRSVQTIGEATHGVKQRDLNAAFVPSSNPRQPATVIVASANGRLVANAAESVVRPVAAALGAPLVVRDVRPLTSGDEIGLGVFLFIIVCTICGYLAINLLYTAAPTLHPRRVYSLIVAVAVLVPTLTYVIAGLGYGAYSGSFATITAFIVISALYLFVIGLVTHWFQTLIGGPLALFLSLAIFVFLNIPSLGGTYTSPMLPSFWRFLNHFWIGASTVNAERSVLYFGSQGVAVDMLRVVAWTAVVGALLAYPMWEQARRRRRLSVAPQFTGQLAPAVADTRSQRRA